VGREDAGHAEVDDQQVLRHPRRVATVERQDEELSAPRHVADALPGRKVEVGVLGSCRSLDAFGTNDGATRQPGRKFPPDGFDLREFGDT